MRLCVTPVSMPPESNVFFVIACRTMMSICEITGRDSEISLDYRIRATTPHSCLPISNGLRVTPRTTRLA